MIKKFHFTFFSILITSAAIAQTQFSTDKLSFQSLDQSIVNLADFKGQFLYIDFWFEGCAPCIQEMPKSREFEKRVKEEDLPITFISISIEDTYEKWKAAVEKYQPAGLSLWAGGKSNRDELIKEYKISSFPKYWLVNAEGLVINPSTGRPSNYLQNDYNMMDRLREKFKDTD